MFYSFCFSQEHNNNNSMMSKSPDTRAIDLKMKDNDHSSNANQVIAKVKAPKTKTTPSSYQLKLARLILVLNGLWAIFSPIKNLFGFQKLVLPVNTNKFSFRTIIKPQQNSTAVDKYDLHQTLAVLKDMASFNPNKTVVDQFLVYKSLPSFQPAIASFSNDMKEKMLSTFRVILDEDRSLMGDNQLNPNEEIVVKNDGKILHLQFLMDKKVVYQTSHENLDKNSQTVYLTHRSKGQCPLYGFFHCSRRDGKYGSCGLLASMTHQSFSSGKLPETLNEFMTNRPMILKELDMQKSGAAEGAPGVLIPFILRHTFNLLYESIVDGKTYEDMVKSIDQFNFLNQTDTVAGLPYLTLSGARTALKFQNGEEVFDCPTTTGILTTSLRNSLVQELIQLNDETKSQLKTPTLDLIIKMIDNYVPNPKRFARSTRTAIKVNQTALGTGQISTRAFSYTFNHPSPYFHPKNGQLSLLFDYSQALKYAGKSIDTYAEDKDKKKTITRHFWPGSITLRPSRISSAESNNDRFLLFEIDPIATQKEKARILAFGKVFKEKKVDLQLARKILPLHGYITGNNNTRPAPTDYRGFSPTEYGEVVDRTCIANSNRYLFTLTILHLLDTRRGCVYDIFGSIPYSASTTKELYSQMRVANGVVMNDYENGQHLVSMDLTRVFQHGFDLAPIIQLINKIYPDTALPENILATEQKKFLLDYPNLFIPFENRACYLPEGTITSVGMLPRDVNASLSYVKEYKPNIEDEVYKTYLQELEAKLKIATEECGIHMFGQRFVGNPLPNPPSSIDRMMLNYFYHKKTLSDELTQEFADRVYCGKGVQYSTGALTEACHQISQSVSFISLSNDTHSLASVISLLWAMTYLGMCMTLWISCSYVSRLLYAYRYTDRLTVETSLVVDIQGRGVLSFKETFLSFVAVLPQLTSSYLLNPMTILWPSSPYTPFGIAASEVKQDLITMASQTMMYLWAIVVTELFIDQLIPTQTVKYSDHVLGTKLRWVFLLSLLMASAFNPVTDLTIIPESSQFEFYKVDLFLLQDFITNIIVIFSATFIAKAIGKLMYKKSMSQHSFDRALSVYGLNRGIIGVAGYTDDGWDLFGLYMEGWVLAQDAKKNIIFLHHSAHNVSIDPSLIGLDKKDANNNRPSLID